jgi:hypothetical protein
VPRFLGSAPIKSARIWMFSSYSSRTVFLEKDLNSILDKTVTENRFLSINKFRLEYTVHYVVLYCCKVSRFKCHLTTAQNFVQTLFF